MEFRSTNDLGYTHHLGDLVAQVGSSHGVKLTGGSTGGFIDAVGDDANITLAVRQKGTGLLRLGSTDAGAEIILRGDQITLGGSASTVTFTGVAFTIGAPSSFSSTDIQLNSTRIQVGTSGALVTVGATTLAQLRIGGSTAPFNGFLRQNNINSTTPAFASTDCGKTAESTVTFAGVTSSHYVMAQVLTQPAGLQLVGAYPVASTAGSVHLVYVNGSTVAVGATTASIRLLALRF